MIRRWNPEIKKMAQEVVPRRRITAAPMNACRPAGQTVGAAIVV
jgi:hypothetical protein